MSRPPARLVLEDGTVFTGQAFGACGSPITSTGEVVFNTAMCGYQESLTDPSYAGQILTMTAPMMGNYGVCSEDAESTGSQVSGFVVRELTRLHSNYRAVGDLSGWLSEAGVLALEGIDTRALVRRLRIEGSMRGVISNDPSHSDADLVDLARSSPPMAGRNLVATVSPDCITEWKAGLGEWGARTNGWDGAHKQLRVLALDCGAKQNIYRHLVQRGCQVMSAPYNFSADEIRKLKPDGLFISNGPGDPAVVAETISVLKEVAGEIPTFGICLGHQILALALGARTYKLKFGHRGTNQPVRSLLPNQVQITSQNHGFCVDLDSLAGIDCEVTHIHLNDGTVAGFRHLSRPIFAVQFHPEASPGPHDSAGLFDCFVLMMRTTKPLDAEMIRQASGTPPETVIAPG